MFYQLLVMQAQTSKFNEYSFVSDKPSFQNSFDMI